MAAALPVSKLAGLLIKTLSKPMAKRIKKECNRSPTAIKMLVSIGQASHQLTSRMTIWASGYKVRKINPLETDEAKRVGAEFLGESIVFLVAGSVVVFEYNSSKEKEKKKEEKRLAEVHENAAALEARLHAIDERLSMLEQIVESHHQDANIGKALSESNVSSNVNSGESSERNAPSQKIKSPWKFW